MPPIKLTQSNLSIATLIGNDADVANEFGIINATNVEIEAPVTAEIPKIDPVTGDPLPPEVKTYPNLIDATQREDLKKKVRNSAALTLRYVGPITSTATNTNPSLNFTSETQVLSSLPILTEVSRSVLVSFNATTYVDVIDTGIEFLMKVNNAQQGSTLKFFHNLASTHASLGGSWIASLPAATASTITIHSTFS